MLQLLFLRLLIKNQPNNVNHYAHQFRTTTQYFTIALSYTVVSQNRRFSITQTKLKCCSIWLISHKCYYVKIVHNFTIWQARKFEAILKFHKGSTKKTCHYLFFSLQNLRCLQGGSQVKMKLKFLSSEPIRLKKFLGCWYFCCSQIISFQVGNLAVVLMCFSNFVCHLESRLLQI